MSKLTKFGSLALIVAAALLASACSESSSRQMTPEENVSRPRTATASQSPATAAQELPATPVLATPYAASPAAGICAEAPSETLVSVEIFPDIPSPRCLKVNASQKLQVFNRTDSTLQLSLGHLEHTLPPQEETILEEPFGDYLAPGVHRLSAKPFSGPEIFLVDEE